MEAIICNAGSGTRLKEIGRHFINKGLIKDPNTEKSILWYQIDALNYIGIKNVYVVVSTTTNDAFKVEVEKIRGRFNNMNIQCVTGNTSTMIDSIKTGLSFTTDQMIIKLDGDVCPIKKDILSGLQNLKENYICIYKMEKEHKKDGSLVISNNKIELYENDPSCEYAWSCIDIWKREDLQYILDVCYECDKGYLLKNINRHVINKKINKIEIPTIYEVDDILDYNNLLKKWEERSRELEKNAVQMWRNFKEYPVFGGVQISKTTRDFELFKEYFESGILLDVGAGTGLFTDFALKEYSNLEYIFLEPNKYWCELASEKYNIKSIQKTFGEYLKEDNKKVDFTIMFGSIIYMLNDCELINNLSTLNSKKLLLKASEPDIRLFNRLLVHEFSKRLGFEYISLYRSCNIVCDILRCAGWRIIEVRQNIYTEDIDTDSGNKTFMIYAERI
jgi:dTDP-glucose pyrophosphorylase